MWTPPSRNLIGSSWISNPVKFHVSVDVHGTGQRLSEHHCRSLAFFQRDEEVHCGLPSCLGGHHHPRVQRVDTDASDGLPSRLRHCLVLSIDRADTFSVPGGTTRV